MDIKLTESSIRKFLETKVSFEEVAAKVSLCGPTFDRYTKIDNDYIAEIEAITNRIDTASAQGVAREAVAILNQFEIQAKFNNDPYKEIFDFETNIDDVFKIDIENKNLITRFTAIALKNTQIGESPSEVKTLLENCGQRSINSAVDITNELTLLYGMPSHIFDLDKIGKQYLYIRESKKGEEIALLDGTKNKLHGNDIIIEDGNGKIIDLCGVMGGSFAEVTSDTKNILLIVPVYSPKYIRKTSLYLQKRTLASQIYEKSPDAKLCLPVIKQAIDLFSKRTCSEVSSKVFDFYPNQKSTKEVHLNLEWLNKFIGIHIPKEKVITILSDLGFGGSENGDNEIVCNVPSFRYEDINIREDLAEEIARIYGYFRLPSVLPCVNTNATINDKLLRNELKAKKYLSNIGFSEIFNNSLISEKLVNNCQLKISEHLGLNNSLSKDYEYLRISLIPSLLTNLKNNTGTAQQELNLYELSNTYQKRNKGNIPNEVSTLSLVSTQDFRKVKGVIESLFDQLNIKKVAFTPCSVSISPLFLSKKSADIVIDNRKVGQIGYVNPTVANTMDIEINTVIVELNFASLSENISSKYLYQPVSSYPELNEVVTIESNQFIGEIIEIIRNTSQFIKEIIYTNSYKNKHTFKIVFSSDTNNLNQLVANEIKEKIQNNFK